MGLTTRSWKVRSHAVIGRITTVAKTTCKTLAGVFKVQGSRGSDLQRLVLRGGGLKVYRAGGIGSGRFVGLGTFDCRALPGATLCSPALGCRSVLIWHVDV